MKDLFTPKLVHAITTDPVEYEQAFSIMTDREISLASVTTDSIPVEALDREELAMSNIMDAMSAFIGASAHPPPQQGTAGGAGEN